MSQTPDNPSGSEPMHSEHKFSLTGHEAAVTIHILREHLQHRVKTLNTMIAFPYFEIMEESTGAIKSREGFTEKDIDSVRALIGHMENVIAKLETGGAPSKPERWEWNALEIAMLLKEAPNFTAVHMAAYICTFKPGYYPSRLSDMEREMFDEVVNEIRHQESKLG